MAKLALRTPKSTGAGSVEPVAARANNQKVPATRRIPAQIKTLLTMLEAGDLDSVVTVYRDAMTATRKYWIDEGKDERGKCKGHWETEADHRTRITAANMVAAYMEGLPIQRQIQMRGDFVELSQLIDSARQSSEAMRLLNVSAISLPSGSEGSE